MELKDTVSAIQSYSKALDIDPSSHEINFRLSTIYNFKEEYEKAKEYAKKSVRIKESYAPALYELGFAEMMLCNIVAAKYAFENAKVDRNFRKEVDKILKAINYHTRHCN